jgi:hypothetical protein
MGQHSKDNQAKGTTFRDNPLFGGTAEGGRSGIGNGTADVNGPHGVAPGDGGLGAHAINNGTTTTDGVDFLGGLGFSVIANPITGGAPDPTHELICESAP